MAEAQMTVIDVGSLDDLEVIATRIEIARPDGAVLRVPVRSLTPLELQEEKRAVRWPTPPQMFLPGAKGQKPVLSQNFEDPAYKDAQEQAATEFNYRVVVRCLVGGGVKLRGDTDDERLADAKARIGTWAMTALSRALSIMHGATNEELEEALKTSAQRGA